MSEQHGEAGNGAGTPPGVRSRLGADLAPRLASGIVMGLLAAVCTFLSATAFAGLVIVVTLLLSWEWGRLVHGRDGDLLIAVQACAAGGAAVLAALGYVGLGLLALPIGAILAMLLSLGRNSLYSALGVFYAGVPAVALIWLRADAPMGLIAVVFVILIVIASDTAGFLAGRMLGGPKLWPRVSPNKTWSGFLGRGGGERDHCRALLVCRSGQLGRCGWRPWACCCPAWRRWAISPSPPSSAASEPRTRAR